MPQQKAVCDLHPCHQTLCQWPQAVQQVGQRQLPDQLPYQLRHQLMLQPQTHQPAEVQESQSLN